MEMQTDNKIKKFHSDNGGEYMNKTFKEFCAKHGIIMQTTAPYSPAQNGIAEGLNRTLLEHARALMFAKNLPKILWPEAVVYTCYIKNKVTHVGTRHRINALSGALQQETKSSMPRRVQDKLLGHGTGSAPHQA
jgi:transposase InsO family protein